MSDFKPVQHVKFLVWYPTNRIWGWNELLLIIFTLITLPLGYIGMRYYFILILAFPISSLKYDWGDNFVLLSNFFERVQSRSFSSLVILVITTLVVLFQIVIGLGIVLIWFLYKEPVV